MYLPMVKTSYAKSVIFDPTASPVDTPCLSMSGSPARSKGTDGIKSNPVDTPCLSMSGSPTRSKGTDGIKSKGKGGIPPVRSFSSTVGPGMMRKGKSKGTDGPGMMSKGKGKGRHGGRSKGKGKNKGNVQTEGGQTEGVLFTHDSS